MQFHRNIFSYRLHLSFTIKALIFDQKFTNVYIFCISNTNKYDEYPLLQKNELKNQKILNNYKFV